jgi:1,4-alpha-glucan branching enzyme
MPTNTNVSAEGDAVLVEFRLPHAVDAEQICLLGEFNDWSPTAHPMERDGDSFVTKVVLLRGRAYRFRYLLDGDRWENDWAADAYVPNEFGGDDSVIDLTEPNRRAAANDGADESLAPTPDTKPAGTQKRATTKETA